MAETGGLVDWKVFASPFPVAIIGGLSMHIGLLASMFGVLMLFQQAV
jgi:hypothetical protein